MCGCRVGMAVFVGRCARNEHITYTADRVCLCVRLSHLENCWTDGDEDRYEDGATGRKPKPQHAGSTTL
jgi:hypothetical protein